MTGPARALKLHAERNPELALAKRPRRKTALIAVNWRRGLFRLWIVGAALFVIAVASISYSGIKAEFDAVARAPKLVTDPKLIEQLEAAVASKPKAAAPSAELPPGYVLDKPPPRLTPVDYDPFAPNPWTSVGVAAGIAVGIPLVVLILGASLVWAFSGFAATTRPN